MIFLIDANNLAGKLDLLDKKDFDEILIGILKRIYQSKGIRIILVFDGVDLMGDKYQDGNIEVIYTPRDSYYKSADDKIKEIVVSLKSKVNDEVRVITDDREIINEVEKLAGANSKIKILKASVLAEKLKIIEEQFQNEDEDSDNGDRSLSTDEIKTINDEFLKIWK
jgi:predicted RNA-binding protein with PIN domain